MSRLLIGLMLVTSVRVAVAQTPAAPPPKPAAPPAPTAPATPPQGAPAAPAAPRPAARAAVATALSFLVTDSIGAPLGNVKVSTSAPLARDGVTGPDGLLRFTNMRAGTYRVTFEREGSITREREVTVRNGESLTIDVALTAAPPPKVVEVVKPVVPEPAAKTLGAPEEPKVTPVPLFLERNFIGREGRKDSPLGCTSTSTATLHQMREAWLAHSHDTADEWIYVVAGEGNLRIGTADQKITAGTFSLVPHTLSHALLPSGRNPLIVISILSGPACSTP